MLIEEFNQLAEAMPAATNKLHILSLKKNLEINKPFLKTISKCKTGKKCKRLINKALQVRAHCCSAFALSLCSRRH